MQSFVTDFALHLHRCRLSLVGDCHFLHSGNVHLLVHGTHGHGRRCHGLCGRCPTRHALTRYHEGTEHVYLDLILGASHLALDSQQFLALVAHFDQLSGEDAGSRLITLFGRHPDLVFLGRHARCIITRKIPAWPSHDRDWPGPAPDRVQCPSAPALGLCKPLLETM